MVIESLNIKDRMYFLDMTLYQQVVQDLERTLLAKRDENVATVSHPDVYCCKFWSGGFLEELRL